MKQVLIFMALVAMFVSFSVRAQDAIPAPTGAGSLPTPALPSNTAVFNYSYTAPAPGSMEWRQKQEETKQMLIAACVKAKKVPQTTARGEIVCTVPRSTEGSWFASSDDDREFYQRGWFWGTVGGVAGVALAAQITKWVIEGRLQEKKMDQEAASTNAFSSGAPAFAPRPRAFMLSFGGTFGGPGGGVQFGTPR